MEFDREYRRLIMEFSEGAIRKIIQKFQNDASEQEIRREIQDFEKYKQSLQKKDPFQYKSWIEFTEAIHAAKGKSEFKKKKAPTKDLVANQEDIIADDENVTIYRGDSQDKCVLYGKGYSFCISKSGGGNLYPMYRLNDKSTFYFIYFKKKPKSEKDHIMVLDHTSHGYQWTFADNNTRPVRGGWKEIVSKYPELGRYEKLLVNKELDDVEKDFLERKTEFIRQLPSYNNDPNVDLEKALFLWNNFSHKEKAAVLTSYYQETLHDVIWKQLDSSLRNEYINMIPDLSPYQMDDLTPKEVARYKKLRNTLFDEEYSDEYPEFEANKLDDIENVLKHPYFAMTYMISWNNNLDSVPDEVLELLAEDPDLSLEYAEWVAKKVPNTPIPADIYESIMESGKFEKMSDELREYFGKNGYFGKNWDESENIQESTKFDKEYRKIMNQYSAKLIHEKVFGNLAWVFHRTRQDPTQMKLHKRGFDSYTTDRAMYGPGLYTTYSLESQMNDVMRSEYGENIIKGKINLDNMLILDKNVYEKTHNNKNFIDYLKSEGLTEQIINELQIVEYTSIVAHKIWKYFYHKKDGMIFTGQRDGNVAVLWHPNNFIPSSFSLDEGKSWKKLDTDIKNIKSRERSVLKFMNQKSEEDIIDNIISKGKKIPQKFIDYIASDPKLSYDYAVNKFKGIDVPSDIIKSLSSIPYFAYSFASEFLGRDIHPHIFTTIANNPYYAFSYASDVLEWKNVPKMIMDSIKNSEYEEHIPQNFTIQESFQFDEEYRILMTQYSNELINEEVYGGLAWVFHRTGSNPEKMNLHTNGIDNHMNTNALLGKGLYATSFLEDQLKEGMDDYGEYIVKGKINLNNMLILDKNVFQKYKPNASFEKYLYYEEGLNEEEIMLVLKNGYIFNYDRFYLKKDGMFYLDSKGVHSTVIWNPKNFIASSYSENNGKTWKKLNPNIRNIKRVIDNRGNIFKDKQKRLEKLMDELDI